MKLAADMRMDRFGPNLTTCLLNLVIEMVEHCKRNNYSLEGVSAFDSTHNEWPQALLKIYKQVYTADC